MADLSLITEFSGITITSDQYTGTNNPNGTMAVASVTTAQRDLLENVTPYVVNAVTVKVKNGTMIYNITSGLFQLFRNGQWENISTNITTATGVGLTSSPFSIPSGPRASVEVMANQKNGFIYNDTTNNYVRGYINTQWMTLFSVGTGTAGVGLTNGAPFSIPSGPRVSVEVAANQINGFIYNDTTNNYVRGYINTQWMTLFSVGTAGTAGVGLTNGAPFVYPTGPRVSVEVAANQINGFTYFDSTNTVIRTYKGAWQTITSV